MKGEEGVPALITYRPIFETVMTWVNVPLVSKATPVCDDMTVQIVSVDRRSKNITIRNENGGTESLPVLGDAGRHLGMLRTGRMFTLTCQDNEKGEHQGITAIKAAKPAAK